MGLGLHVDSNGIERIGNQWGFNSFVTQEGAAQTAQSIGQRGSHWYIWRLADGTFDFTATANPNMPGHPAELVDEFTVEYRGKRRD